MSRTRHSNGAALNGRRWRRRNILSKPGELAPRDVRRLDDEDVQQPNTKPGFYYVSVVDGPSSARLLGPFEDDHRGALDAVAQCTRMLGVLDPRTHFWAFGTCRLDQDAGIGFLGRRLDELSDAGQKAAAAIRLG